MAAIIKVLKNEKGSALLYTLIVFSLVFALSMSIYSIFYSNLNQAKSQENKMEAYYLSHSGVLMGYSALTQDKDGHGNPDYGVLKDLSDGTISPKSESNISLGQGTISIEAEKSTDAIYLDWVKVTSVAELDSGKGSSTSTLYINPDDPNEIKWGDYER